MRHGLAGNRLGRNQSLRKATVRDLAKATLVHQRILTTKAKAKEARKLVDRLITLGKKGTLAHRRKAFSILSDHALVSELFKTTSKRFHSRLGGYTRIIPLSLRRGDNAQLAFLELTEKTEVIVSKPKSDAVAKPVTVVKAEGKKPGKTTKPQGEKIPKSEITLAAQPKEKLHKPEPSKALPKPPLKEKPKPSTFISGLKKMFTKRPPGGK